MEYSSIVKMSEKSSINAVGSVAISDQQRHNNLRGRSQLDAAHPDLLALIDEYAPLNASRSSIRPRRVRDRRDKQHRQ